MKPSELSSEARDLSRDLRRSPARTIAYLAVLLVLVVATMWMTGFFGELGRRTANAADEPASADASELSADARGILDLVYLKGDWRPVAAPGMPNTIAADGHYAGKDKQPYSFADLAAVGALSQTPEGVFALYAVLGHHSNDRTRLSRSWILPSADGVSAHWNKEYCATEMPKDRALWEQLEIVQAYLITHKEELIESGRLRP